MNYLFVLIMFALSLVLVVSDSVITVAPSPSTPFMQTVLVNETNTITMFKVDVPINKISGIYIYASDTAVVAFVYFVSNTTNSTILLGKSTSYNENGVAGIFFSYSPSLLSDNPHCSDLMCNLLVSFVYNQSVVPNSLANSTLGYNLVISQAQILTPGIALTGTWNGNIDSQQYLFLLGSSDFPFQVFWLRFIIFIPVECSSKRSNIGVVGEIICC